MSYVEILTSFGGLFCTPMGLLLQVTNSHFFPLLLSTTASYFDPVLGLLKCQARRTYSVSFG